MSYIGTKPGNQVIDGSLIANGTITTNDLADNAVTATKIANGAVTVDKLLASGTPGSGNFLRGDGTWQSVSAPVTSVSGRTGAVVLTSSDVGLGNVPNVNTTDAANISAGRLARARMPAGSILQVVQVVKTDRFSTTSTSYVDITGMSASITPSSASSRVLVVVDLKGSASNSAGGGVQLQRDGTAIYIGDAQGSRRRSSVGGYWPFNGAAVYGGMAMFLDSPATTSAITYKLQCVTQGATFAVNSSHAYTDSADNLVLASSITLLEVAV